MDYLDDSSPSNPGCLFTHSANAPLTLCTLAVLFTLAPAFSATAQLRIVTYNTAGMAYTGSGTDRIDTVLQAIGEELGNNGKSGVNYASDGIAKPIDILLLQEQELPSNGAGANHPSPTTQSILALLNSAYAGQGVTYSMTNRTGTGDTTQTLIFRNETVQLIGDTAFKSSSQPRQTLRYQLRPVGYSSAADFYIYNSHYKASEGTSNAAEREDEATAIRANSNALGEGAHIIYAGDHNFYDYTELVEPAFQTLIAAGAGQANDPVNQVGTWHNNANFASIHSQSPCLNSVGNCGVGGGMDDRFDFQLVSGEFLDGQGLSYISNSYHSFGNNGSTFNSDINSGSNTVTLSGVTSYTKQQVLNALHTVTDHLPVVADYQVPAIMQASAATIPTSIDLGSTFDLSVTVNNAANVVAVNGADVLHYSLTTSGDVSGSFLNQSDAALGGSNVHLLPLSTSTTGMKSGLITLTSTSQAVQNGTINIPVNFLVVLPGDYNGDGKVDAADYAVWRKNAGLVGGATYSEGDGDRDGNVTQVDYNVWRSHFGESAGGAEAALGATSAVSTVPEPCSLWLLSTGICLGSLRRDRLKAWIRQS